MQAPAGLILAGGASRRFGADKARHPVDGRPMLVHVYTAVAAVATPVFVGLRTPPGAPLPVPATVVTDRFEEAGPLAGLHAGLLAAPTPWLLAVACDLPFVTPEALTTLLRHRTPETRAVVAQDGGGRLQPLCACYPTAILPLVEEHLRTGRRALHTLLDRLEPITRVTLPDAVLRNVNRTTDLVDDG